MNIFRKLLIPYVYSRNKSRQLDYLSYMKHHEYNTIEENRNIQKQKLFDLVIYAFENIPYYQNLKIEYKAFSKETIFEDIKRIPFLTKKIIKDQYENLSNLDRPYNRIYEKSTGGSTGEPLIVKQNNEYLDWELANKLLYEHWAGRDLGELKIKFWHVLGNKKITSKIADWIRNVKYLNAFKCTPRSMNKYAHKINRYKPTIIEASVGSFTDFTRYIYKNGFKMYSPHTIISTAGPLFEKNKDWIKKVFKCDVLSRYGSRECGDMACSCTKDEGLHENIFTNYIEIINENGDLCKSGEIGDVVVTLFTNYTMPLIRYKIGDRASRSKEQCSCGRGLPLIDFVYGRAGNTIKTSDGGFVSMGIMILQLDKYLKGLDYNKYQMIQEKPDELIIKIESEQDLLHNYKKLFSDLIKSTQKKTKTHLNLRFECTDQLEYLPNGKFQMFIDRMEEGKA